MPPSQVEGQTELAQQRGHPLAVRAREGLQQIGFDVDELAITTDLDGTLLRDDGTALTEFQAIAYWLARTNPRARLMPGDPDGDALVMEVMDYVVGTIHMQGFARIFTTSSFTPDPSAPDPSAHDAVQARGREIAAKGLGLMDRVLEGKDYVAGAFSIADAALFYVEFWADKTAIELPPNCRAHYHRMRARPACARALEREGGEMFDRDFFEIPDA